MSRPEPFEIDASVINAAFEWARVHAKITHLDPSEEALLAAVNRLEAKKTPPVRSRWTVTTERRHARTGEWWRDAEMHSPYLLGEGRTWRDVDVIVGPWVPVNPKARKHERRQ